VTSGGEGSFFGGRISPASLLLLQHSRTFAAARACLHKHCQFWQWSARHFADTAAIGSATRLIVSNTLHVWCGEVQWCMLRLTCMFGILVDREAFVLVASSCSALFLPCMGPIGCISYLVAKEMFTDTVFQCDTRHVAAVPLHGMCLWVGDVACLRACSRLPVSRSLCTHTRGVSGGKALDLRPAEATVLKDLGTGLDCRGCVPHWFVYASLCVCCLMLPAD
jgi:hypothetical protein